MSEFEAALASVIGSFIETELDYLEKENNELERLQHENQQLKEKMENSKNLFTKNLNGMLSEGIEPDPEDFYLAEIEGKAKACDKYKQALNEIRKIFNKKDEEYLLCEGLDDILPIIDKALESKNNHEK